MRNEMAALKSDNEKLAEDVVRRSLHSSRTSLNQITDAAAAGCEDSLDVCEAASSSGGSKSSMEEGKAGSSLVMADDDKRLSSTLSEGSVLSGPSSLDMSGSTDPTNRDGGRIVTVTVPRAAAGEGQPGGPGGGGEVTLGTISVSGRCSWDLLDSLVQRLFKEYVMRVDPASNLGLGRF